ncbi:hypothetical protein OF897_06420 [Chryseobacterium formosus]|uniref:Uncharacterized protein n=1 Tax=Chryseobacterium formosus TaxID=1537363 RepID=A0ABT3XN53_9FLAO|nr:hypothetical protein [Chryseobacterium formosus]MCX8523552.1 hypothetical protein [Chryseobacterium formosus]
METKNKIDIPLHNEIIRNQISQTIKEFSVLQLHFFKTENSEYTEILILMKETKEAETLRIRPWIGKAAEAYKVHIYISYYHKAEYQLKHGNPFYQYYADPSAIFWKGDNVDELLQTYGTKKEFKKKRNVFKEKFYHDHDILMTEVEKFRSRRMYASAFQSYLTVFEHNIEYLENLFMGWISYGKNIHHRLKHLMRYIPELKKVFVMKDEHSFYLIGKIEESIKAAEEDDESFVSSESFGAVKAAEEQVYRMVVDRFSELGKMTAFKKTEHWATAAEDTAVLSDVRLEKAVETIVERLSPEEIYMFHKKESYSQNGTEKVVYYYLLLIGEGLGDNSLYDTQQSVRDKSRGKVNVIILGHRRFSIQDRLFQSQEFMHKIMTDENRVYASHRYHPPIHWEYLSSDEHGDVCIYYNRMIKTVKQYFVVREKADAENDELFFLLFSHALMRILRFYLYCSLSNYFPNFSKMDDTWNLCLYADPSLEKIEFLFEKISPEFFRLTNSFLKYTDRSYCFQNNELPVMDEILNTLLGKLEKLIKGSNLRRNE